MTPELREKVRVVGACTKCKAGEGLQYTYAAAIDRAPDCDACLDLIINCLRYYFRKGVWPEEVHNDE